MLIHTLDSEIQNRHMSDVDRLVCQGNWLPPSLDKYPLGTFSNSQEWKHIVSPIQRWITSLRLPFASYSNPSYSLYYAFRKANWDHVTE